MIKKSWKRFSMLLVVAVMGCGIGTSGVEAKSISVNLHTGGNTLAPSDSAGVAPTTGWNNVIANGGAVETSFTGLMDDSGNLTTVDMRGNGWGANSPELVFVGGNPYPAAAGNANATMMLGGGISGIRPVVGSIQYAAQVELTNVLAEVGGPYDVYVYIGTGWGDTPNAFMGGAGTAILSSGEYTFTTTNGAAEQFDVPTSTVVATQQYATMRGTNAGLGIDPVYTDTTGFIESTGQAVNQKGNYVKFTGITAADLVITIDPNAVGYQWNQNSILGIQVIGPATVPEPSTFALAGLGLVGLVGYGLRRRKK